MNDSSRLPAAIPAHETREQKIARRAAGRPSQDVMDAMNRETAAAFADQMERLARIPWPPRR